MLKALFTLFKASVAEVWLAASANTAPLATDTLLNVVVPVNDCVPDLLKVTVPVPGVNAPLVLVQSPPTFNGAALTMVKVPPENVTFPVTFNVGTPAPLEVVSVPP